MRSILPWHGGKTYLAPHIIKLIPLHIHYVEPYFGGGAVLFAKEPINSEVVNDINGSLINFWKVLQDTYLFQQFERKMEATPFSQQLWEESIEHQQNKLPSLDGPVTDAVHLYIQYRQSRQSIGKTFATMGKNRTRRGMNEKASAWLSSVERLPEIHTRLKRVIILRDNAIKVIKQQDGINTFFYLDPPYLHETRQSINAYEYEMSRKDHIELLETLANVKGKLILSSYPSSLYREAGKKCGWNKQEIKIDNKASSLKTKPIMTEQLWMNF